ncbi:kinetochore-associated protein NSL1 homolog [Xyrichtys novacula]|uniref:Kinetochore-associated protein NSL1 homolog n=1 Tax=Xyrichtys novacula TaxID=13765 RepID=A0AAV1GV39_XYRNO|nr:kinetochore-associated protein NSL1 homolog [Xyrichtys novacula]
MEPEERKVENNEEKRDKNDKNEELKDKNGQTDETTEYRVRVSSKKTVTEQINKYKEILKTALNGQQNIDEKKKGEIIQDLLSDFEAAVKDNLLVNGKQWEEAPDDEESEALDLESLLDDTIVETTRRRSTYPRKILPHVLHALKAERKLLGLYEQAVKPQEVLRDPDGESIMKDLTAAAPSAVKQAVQVIKSISTLQKQAEGLCQVLDMKTSHASMQIHSEVFASNGKSDTVLFPMKGVTGSRQPIKRAVEDAAVANCYVPLSKKPSAGEKTE